MRKTLLDNEYFTLNMEDGILMGKWKTDQIDINIAEQVLTQRLIAQNGNTYPLVIDISLVRSSSKEARDLLASKKGCEGISRAAILIDSIVGQMLGTFFMYVHKPLIPSKIFTDEKEAKKWLSQF